VRGTVASVTGRGNAAIGLSEEHDAATAGYVDARTMETQFVHTQLCTIELIAEGHAERCPGEDCAFWQRGCRLARVEDELDERPEVAGLLLDLRRALEAGREVAVDSVRAEFERQLFP
jgi:hypothetical protein